MEINQNVPQVWLAQTNHERNLRDVFMNNVASMPKRSPFSLNILKLITTAVLAFPLNC
jgi:hypothetical protein